MLLAVLGVAPFWGSGPTYQLVFFYLLAFGGTSLGCIAARAEQGPVGWVVGFLIGQVYTIYSWFLWPVLVRSTARQLSGRGSWAKTEREAITDAPAAATPTAEAAPDSQAPAEDPVVPPEKPHPGEVVSLDSFRKK